MDKKGIGFIPSGKTHYIDHLAIICSIMDIPLLCIDELEYDLCQKFYPDLNVQRASYQDLTTEHLIATYDVIFNSDFWDEETFHNTYGAIEEKYKKKMRLVHCPHGFSDKGFYLERGVHEDILLIYGQNMLDLLKHRGVIEHLNQHVITGNYRHTYFQKHRDFFDQIVQEEVFSQFDQFQPTILYAPTWMDYEESSSFFHVAPHLIENLPDHYNMIVKLHPLLELNDIVQYHSIIGQYEEKPNVLFIKDFPLVFPLLAHTDIYIGDVSSIGYDFLAFNKPMFFLNRHNLDPETDRRIYQFRCGQVIYPEEFPLIYRIIEDGLSSDQERFSKIRSQVYDYTFGPEKSFEQIRHDITTAYLS